ncbi:unnamed protein product [Pleuronectes platessa]|uniref:Uncharacterized protein n=1 Tax=Pleuronectes platessa TaxID=8262 RepID=A0A9N7TSU9_PLEPL|nr:unnamed protein product [Pleuronectes platessa]
MPGSHSSAGGSWRCPLSAVTATCSVSSPATRDVNHAQRELVRSTEQALSPVPSSAAPLLSPGMRADFCFYCSFLIDHAGTAAPPRGDGGGIPGSSGGRSRRAGDP